MSTVHEQFRPPTGQSIGDRLCAISTIIDAWPVNTARDPEAKLWVACGKIAEEAGEVMKAINGMTGSNPRKGVTHTIDDVEAEVLDTAIAALVTVAHMHHNNIDPIQLLREHLDRVSNRLEASFTP
ncbi:MAG: MazG-like family protein [Propionicimonas sp.]